MSEPRSLASMSQTWLTDSRVYNLIWLGRWLERAEGISRAVNSAARLAATEGTESSGTKGRTLAEALTPVANTLGIAVGDGSRLATDILFASPGSSALHCLTSARLNATQVAPVELIRAIGEAIAELEKLAPQPPNIPHSSELPESPESPESPEQVIAVTGVIAAHITAIYEAIEDRWFSRESFTEEEVFHRFVQQ